MLTSNKVLTLEEKCKQDENLVSLKAKFHLNVWAWSSLRGRK